MGGEVVFYKTLQAQFLQYRRAQRLRRLRPGLGFPQLSVQDCAGDPLNVSVPGRWNGSTVGFEVGHQSGTSEMATDFLHSRGSRGRLAQHGLGGQH